MAVKKIIIPTDFSACARNAVKYAVGLFGTGDVEYTLLNCYGLPHTGAELLISLTDILRLESEEGIEHEHKRLLELIPELEPVMKVRSVNGQLEHVLNRIQREENPDLVVMGTTGASGIMKVIWGSTTTSVLKRVKMPVLSIPVHTEVKPPAEIALALQQNPGNTFSRPPLLVEFTQKFHSHISLITMEEHSATIQSTSLKMAAGSENTSFPVHRHGKYDLEPVQQILDYLDQHPVDMLVMIGGEYGFMRSLFHDSTLREMAILNKVPLLMLRPGGVTR